MLLKPIVAGKVDISAPIPDITWELYSSFNTNGAKKYTFQQAIKFSSDGSLTAEEIEQKEQLLSALWGVNIKFDTVYTYHTSLFSTQEITPENIATVNDDMVPATFPYDSRGPHQGEFELAPIHVHDGFVADDFTTAENNVVYGSDNYAESSWRWPTFASNVKLTDTKDTNEYGAVTLIAITEKDSKFGVVMYKPIDASTSAYEIDKQYPDILFNFLQPDKQYDVYKAIFHENTVISTPAQHFTARPQKDIYNTASSRPYNWEYKENPTGIAASEYFDLYGDNSSYEQGEHLPADYENPIDHCIEMEMIDGTHTHVNIWGYFSPIGESPVYDKKYTTYVYCESYKDVGTMTRWMTMTRPDINQTITMQVEPIFDGQWAVDRDAYFAYEDAPQMFFLDDHHKDVEIILQHFAEIGVWQPATREEYYVIV